MIQFKNDYAIDKIIAEQPSKEQNFLQNMFGKKVEKQAAKAYLKRILDHKWYISERLGRDIGLPVAALDFTVNIEPLPVAKRSRRKTNGGISWLSQAMRFGLNA